MARNQYGRVGALAFWLAAIGSVAAMALAPRWGAVSAAGALLGATALAARALGSRERGAWLLTGALLFLSGLAARTAVGDPIRSASDFVSAGQIAYVVGLPGATAAVLLVAAASGQLVRAQILLTGVLCAACLLGFDLWLAWPRDQESKSAGRFGVVRESALRRGEAFDGRFDHQVIAELRARGAAAYPLLSPTSFLLDPATMQPKVPMSGFVARDGRAFLPLAGIPDVATVYCNETGRWLVYKADELGFSNPPGTWSLQPAEVALLGDSFAQGACVQPDESPADLLRRRFAGVVTAGMGGTGPLIQLAILKEYLSLVRPRLVVWMFYEGNDLHTNLEVEKLFPELVRYLDGEPLGVARYQAELTPFLAAFVERNLVNLENRNAARAVAKPVDWRQVVRLRHIYAAMGFGDCPSRQQDFALLERAFAAGRRTVERWGGELVLAYLPAWHTTCDSLDVTRGWWNWMKPEVVARARAAGLPVIDLHAAMRSSPDPSAYFAHPGSHYGPAGYKLLAELVAAHVARGRPATKAP